MNFKTLFFTISFSFLIISCEKIKEIKLDKNYAFSHKNNPIIKYLRFENSKKIQQVVVYKNFIAISKIPFGFNIYKTKPGIKKYDEYLLKEKPIYISEKNQPAYFEGIYDYFLFIDYGTSAGVRGLEIINLLNAEKIWQGSHSLRIPDKFDSDYIVYIYKYNNERENVPPYPTKFIYKLHQFLFNLKTKEEKDINNIITFEGD